LVAYFAPGPASLWVGAVLLEAFFENAPVLDWDWNLFGILCDAIPELLNECDPLLLWSVIEARRYF
jgi:hypothetical protein